jgi:hypothetical protein
VPTSGWDESQASPDKIARVVVFEEEDPRVLALTGDIAAVLDEDILIFAEIQPRVMPLVVDDISSPLAVYRDIRYVAVQDFVVEVGPCEFVTEIRGEA